MPPPFDEFAMTRATGRAQLGVCAPEIEIVSPANRRIRRNKNILQNNPLAPRLTIVLDRFFVRNILVNCERFTGEMMLHRARGTD